MQSERNIKAIQLFSYSAIQLKNTYFYVRPVFYIFFLVIGIVFIAEFAKAEILLPAGAGNYSAWQNTGGAGAGTFNEVDDWVAPDDDTSYNLTATALAKQSYSLTDTTKTQGAIQKVRVWARVKAIGTTDSVKLFLRVSGNDYFSADIPVTNSYADYYYDWSVNPSNSSNWVVADLNSMEAGFQLAGGASEHRVTQMYAQVQYDSEIKTVKYHVTQKLLPISDGNKINEPFNFYIADDLDEVKSAYIEIRGLSLPANPLTVDVSVDETGDPYPIGSPRLATYTINASNRNLPFKIVHDTTDYFKTFVTGPADYSRYFNLRVTGTSVYVLNAKLVITYSHINPPAITGAYRQFGILTSSAFDTGQANGAAFNSIMWSGLKPAGTRVKLQIATSDNAIGPFNFIGGDLCSDSAFWEPDADAPVEIKCFSQLNNKRYFRYKVRIESNPPNYDSTPRVDDVVVNFSP